MNPDGNLIKYESDEVVSYYEQLKDLQPCEAYLFSKYVRPGLAMLDLGVGGGRTTPHLARGASRYVGADYSRPMVDSCSVRYPDLEFCHCDATDMAQFADGEFDIVVFSFNGIDYITDDASRSRCLAEVARVLRPGGLFIFSSHNAKQLGILPVLYQARPHQIVWRTLRAGAKSMAIAWRTLRSGVFAAGQGYISDPVHGGLRMYLSTRKAIEPQLTAAGLHMEECIRGPYPSVGTDLLTSWHYYACRKVAAHG